MARKTPHQGQFLSGSPDRGPPRRRSPGWPSSGNGPKSEKLALHQAEQRPGQQTRAPAAPAINARSQIALRQIAKRRARLTIETNKSENKKESDNHRSGVVTLVKNIFLGKKYFSPTLEFFWSGKNSKLKTRSKNLAYRSEPWRARPISSRCPGCRHALRSPQPWQWSGKRKTRSAPGWR